MGFLIDTVAVYYVLAPCVLALDLPLQIQKII
jgi:hypothetical protein